jgi:hypothetical protein
MQTDRRSILHLVALDRITPTEAERLLIAWNDGKETRWILASCLAVAVLSQLHINTLLPEKFDSLAHGLKLVTHLLGGIV